MDTLTKLQHAWKPKHSEHLQFCFENCLSFYADSFAYQGVKDDALVIDNKLYIQDDIIKILADYYTDDNSHYQTRLGDTIYLFFTDLVEDDVDILSQIEEISV
jgi:hypothetical protein